MEYDIILLWKELLGTADIEGVLCLFKGFFKGMS